MLSVSLFATSHLETFFNSLFTFFSSLPKLLDSNLREVSSANKVTPKLQELGKSFINIRNREWPKDRSLGYSYFEDLAQRFNVARLHIMLATRQVRC